MGIFLDESGFSKTGKFKIFPTYKQKSVNDFQLAKDMMLYYDMNYNRTEEELAKIVENFHLHSGRWPELQSYRAGTVLNIGNETFHMDGGELLHMPIIDAVTKSIVSDIISTPLVATTKDVSVRGRNYKDRLIIEKLQAMFRAKYIEPKLIDYQRQYLDQLGVQDISMLPIEQVQQMSQEIDQKVADETPEEIMEVFEKTRTPEEIVAQTLFDDAFQSNDIKSKADIGGEYAVVTAEEYYKVGIRLNEPTFDVLNPKYVTWIGSEGVEDCQDGVMAKYERYLLPEDAVQKYGEVLTKSNIKSIKEYCSNIPGWYNDGIYKGADGKEYLTPQKAAMAEANVHFSNKVDFLTRDGQEVLQGLYRTAQDASREGLGIRECYITFKWMRRMKKIERMVDGFPKMLIRDEHYVLNPLSGDISESPIIAPQVWHGTMLGVPGNCFFVNVEPVPYQYKNIDNPFDVKLTIFGGTYNTFQGNAKNVSFVDLGKPWNFKLNMKVKSMETKEASDIGVILQTTITSKPAGWSWAEWFTSLKKSKILITNSHFEGANVNDMQATRAVDLSNKSDLGSDIKLMDYYEEGVYKAMYFSKAKLGQLGQYTTNFNAQISQQGADRQMVRFHNRHGRILRMALEQFMHCTLIAYKNNEMKKMALLDDYSRAFFENALDPFPIHQIGLHIVTDFDTAVKVRELRQYGLTILQNGGTAADIAAMYSADSIPTIQDILDRADKKRQKEAELAHSRQMELQQSRSEAAKEMQRQKFEHDLDVLEKTLANKLEVTKIGAMMLANANDINQDGINDALDKALITTELKRQEIDARHELDSKKLELEMQKLEIERERIRKELEIKKAALKLGAENTGKK